MAVGCAVAPWRFGALLWDLPVKNQRGMWLHECLRTPNGAPWTNLNDERNTHDGCWVEAVCV